MVFTRNANDIHVRKLVLKEIHNILDTLGDHVHPHSITGAATESHVQILPSNCTFDVLKPSKSARSEPTTTTITKKVQHLSPVE